MSAFIRNVDGAVTREYVARGRELKLKLEARRGAARGTRDAMAGRWEARVLEALTGRMEQQSPLARICIHSARRTAHTLETAKRSPTHSITDLRAP